MRARLTVFAAATVAMIACWPGQPGASSARPDADIEQTAQLEQASVLTYLRSIAGRATPTGPAAQKLINLLTAETANGDDSVRPALALSDRSGKLDMFGAVLKADPIKADPNSLRRLHRSLTEGFLGLLGAAEAERERHHRQRRARRGCQ